MTDIVSGYAVVLVQICDSLFLGIWPVLFKSLKQNLRIF